LFEKIKKKGFFKKVFVLPKKKVSGKKERESSLCVNFLSSCYHVRLKPNFFLKKWEKKNNLKFCKKKIEEKFIILQK